MGATSASFSSQHSSLLCSEVAPRDEARRTSQHRQHALVVDDVPDVTEMLAMFLRCAGYHVTTASTASTALAVARALRFDVVLSDIGMPGMDGYELATALRAVPAYQGVPMIAVTGFDMYDDPDRALAAGFNAHLKKPVDPVELTGLITRPGN